MSRPHLLVVDSDVQNLQVMEVSLRKAGFQVTGSASGQEALGKAKVLQPDLVLTEVDVPDLDAFGLLAALRQTPATARTPVIFLTEDARVDRRVKALELGVADYLSKPIYIKEIVARVRIHLQKSERDRLLGQPAADVEGSLTDMGLVDLARTLAQRTGVVTCTSPRGETGTFWVRDGRIEDAELGRLAGEAAFFRLLNWSDGRYHMRLGAHERPRRIQREPQQLLMEGLARLDEWSRLVEQLPGLDAIFEVDFVALALRLGEIPDEVNAVLRLFDGRRDVRQVVDESPFDDAATVSVVLRLQQEAIIRLARSERSPVTRALESWGTPPTQTATRVDAPETTTDPDVRLHLPTGRDGKPLRGAALARALASASTLRRTEIQPQEPVGGLAEAAGIALAQPSAEVLAAIADVTPPAAAPALPAPIPEPAPILPAPIPVASIPEPVAAAPAETDESLSWANADTDPALPAVDLASLLAAEGPAAPAHADATEAIPVVRYPPKRGARKARLAAEAQRAREQAAAQGQGVAQLTREVAKPGAAVSPPKSTPVETPPSVRPAAHVAPANTESEDDDEFAAVLKKRSPLKAAAIVVVVAGAAAAVAMFSGKSEETPVAKPAATAVAAPTPKPPEPAPPAPVEPQVAAVDPTTASVDAGPTEVTAPPDTSAAPVTPPVEPTAQAAAPVKEPVAPTPPTPPAPAKEPTPPTAPIAAKPPVPVAEPTPAMATASAPADDAEFDKLLAAGVAANQKEQFARAVTSLQKAVKIKGNDAVALRELGKALLNTEKTESARTTLLKATKASDTDAEAFMYLGLANQELERSEDAARAYRRFLQLEPKASARHKEISTVLEHLER